MALVRLSRRQVNDSCSERRAGVRCLISFSITCMGYGRRFNTGVCIGRPPHGGSTWMRSDASRQMTAVYNLYAYARMICRSADHADLLPITHFGVKYISNDVRCVSFCLTLKG